MIQPDASGLYHPADEADIIDLIQYAVQNKRQVRVKGAAQSVPASIFTDGYTGDTASATTDNINIMLDQMHLVTFTPNSNLVDVQAGCHLGFDPYDSAQTSTEANSLFAQLGAKGLAIPNVPDAMHQTVGGYISTGSSGGSVAHSFLEAIVAIRLIDGTGKVHVFNKPNPDDPNDPFYAAGVSLGLLGVITEVTLQCIPASNIIGTQSITTDMSAAFDFFGNGSAIKPSLKNYLSNTEFTRLIWWPFPTVKRLVAWKARTMQPADYNNQTGTPEHFLPKPYKALFPVIGGSQLPSEIVVSSLYALIGNWPNILKDLFGNEIDINGKKIDTSIIETFIDLIWPLLLPKLLNVFAPCDGTNPPQQFWDTWANGLAMDTFEYSNNLLTAYRNEFWVPLAEAQLVMSLLDNYYQNQYFKRSDSDNSNYANGCFVVEVLGAKSNGFWLSPSYQQDSLRINFYSLQQTSENVMAYYQQFWDLFFSHKINFRPHWGYYLPPPSAQEGAAYISKQYPMWNAFMALRKTMDPDNIFLNSYWKAQLNIDTAAG